MSAAEHGVMLCTMSKLLERTYWAARRAKGHHPMDEWRVAVLALARKIAGILYAIWRDAPSTIPPTRRRARRRKAKRPSRVAELRLSREGERETEREVSTTS